MSQHPRSLSLRIAREIGSHLPAHSDQHRAMAHARIQQDAALIERLAQRSGISLETMVRAMEIEEPA